MTPSDDSSLTALTDQLREANEEFTRHYPGETGHRQPVHTVYGGAHLFKSDTAKRLGSLARRSLDQFAPDFLTFARAVELPGSDELPDSMEEANELVSFLKTSPNARAKRKKALGWLTRFIVASRKNFSANRLKTFASILKTDTGIVRTMKKTVTRFQPLLKRPKELRMASLPPFIGIRIKPFNEELRARSFRTLDIFVSTLARSEQGSSA